MAFKTHLKVLLWKNAITLQRNYCFAITFVVLPLFTMGFFLYAVTINDAHPTTAYPNMMFYSTTNVKDYTKNVTNNTFMTTSNVSVGNFFDDCDKQNLTQIAITGTQSNTEPLMKILNSTLKNFDIVLYDSQNDIQNEVQTDPNDVVCFGMDVQEFDLDNDVYNIQLQFPSSNIPSTNNQPYDFSINTPNFEYFNDYQNSGFLEVYPLITKAILNAKKQQGVTIPDIDLEVAYVPMMTGEYTAMNQQIVQILQLIFPTFFMFTYLIPLYYMVSKLSEEKQSKSKEGMKMMGLNEFVYFLSWFILFFIVMVVMGLVIISLIGPGIFKESNKFLILMMCILYGISLFAESMLITSLLPNARSSATLATLFHVITYFLVYTVQNPSSTFVAKFFLSFFPNIAMALSIYTMFHFEEQASGLTFQTTNSQYANYSFTEGLLMLTLDFLLYSGIAYYIDQISSEYGVHKPWYFLCSKKYWSGFCKKNRQNNQPKPSNNNSAKNQLLSIQNEFDVDDEVGGLLRHPENFEQVPEQLLRQEKTGDCLKIKGLRREFGNKVAVNNLSLTMYSGQIFALLGHNGAGKTTTISMLTGLIEKTKGTATVFGLNVFEEQEELRQQMGVCFQHDVLFEYLTPKEHLRLFAAFKGTESEQIEKQVEQMINDLDLIAVQNTVVKTLSGGQKRKLSVGIAMIGNSKLIILDEPTSGMDTSSRRRLWEMLKQQKMGRIIILTTHYMDEADILGDRIAIMAAGTVKTCGSSLFLKNRFGVGYNLVIAKVNRDNAPQIDQFVKDQIPKSIKLQEVSSEMTFQLPTEAHELFREFFTLMDSKLQELGISSYGVGITTLEEVFLRIGKDENEDEELKMSSSKQSSSHPSGSFNGLTEEAKENGTLEVLQGTNIQNIEISQKSNNKKEIDDYSIAENAETGTWNLFSLQFQALFRKKLLLQVRDLRSLVIEIFFPIILIICGLALTTLVVVSSHNPRQMSPSIFPSSTLLYNTNGVLEGNSEIYVNQYFDNSYFTPSPITLNTYNDQFESQNDAFFNLTQQMNQQLFETQVQNNAYFGNYYFYDLTGEQSGKMAFVLFVNCTSQDAVGAYGAYIHQIFLQNITKSPNLQLNIQSYPLPLSLKEQGFVTAIAGTFASVLFAMSYMMISKSLVENIIRERERNVKHQILVSGAGLPAYWISHYVGDIIFESLPSIAAIIAYKAFHIELPGAWVFFVVYIFINPVFVYALSAMFQSEATASIMIRIIYIILGVILPVGKNLIIVYLNIATAGLICIPGTFMAVGEVIRWFFFIFPIFCLDYGILVIAVRSIIALNNESIKDASPMSEELAGPAVYFLIIDWFFYWALLGLIEYGYLGAFFKRFRNNTVDEQKRKNSEKSVVVDSDVITEEQRVRQTNPTNSNLTVRLQDFRKVYEDLVAVDQLTFGLEYGECFALLGTTGAGKTTTFKCLTGHEKPTRGLVHINGFDVTTAEGFEQARRQLGYCPQFDAIFEGMTVIEHLQFYAKIKGILRHLREEIVQNQIEEMDLKEYVNTKADKLSGGNKRKLSVAMAMIGNPPIVFLDEPSTGVDPKAKRFMWSIVSKLSTQRKKSSVIITTHSMEEAEALCTKMAIMVNGRFQCFGSSQHIKEKFGTGFELEIKIRSLKEEEIEKFKEEHGFQKQRMNKAETEQLLNAMDASELIHEIKEDGQGYIFHDSFQKGQTIYTDELIKWIHAETKGADIIQQLELIFKSLHIIEHLNNSYKLKVSKDNHTIGYLFGFMEEIKHEFEISEYSVNQTSLEQIFNNFAKSAELGTNRRPSIARRSIKRAVSQRIEEEIKRQNE